MMFETKPVRITELAKETNNISCRKGAKKAHWVFTRRHGTNSWHFRVRMFIRVQPQKFF